MKRAREPLVRALEWSTEELRERTALIELVGRCVQKVGRGSNGYYVKER